MKWSIILGTLFAILSGVLLGGSSVSAVSEYDDLVVLTDELYTCSSASNYVDCSTPLTTEWVSHITDRNKYFTGFSESYKDDLELNGKDSLLQAFDTGRWGVFQRVNNSGDKNINVVIVWTEDDSLTIEFQNITHSGGFQVLALTGNNLHVATITNTGDYAGGDSNISTLNDVQVYSGTSGEFIVEENWSGNRTSDIFLIYADNVTYPVDYEGEIIPDGIDEEPDYNAGTGLIPISDYTVDDLDISIIDITSQSEKILYKIDECYFQLPNNSYGDNFTEYMYDCDNPTTIEHTFGDGFAGYNIIHRMHSTETDLWYESTQVLDIDGSTFSGSIGKIEEDIFSKCVNDDAPYLHFKDCLKTFGKITNSMSFGAIKPLGAFRYEPTSECKELGVLGNWLNLDNKEICPQFSEEVRTVVTPFISFGVSLGVLGAILTKSSKEYM